MANLFGLFGGTKTNANTTGAPVVASGLVPATTQAVIAEDPAVVRQRQADEARLAAEQALAARIATIEAEQMSVSSVAEVYAKRHETRTPDAVRSDITATTGARDRLAVQHKAAVAECLAVEAELKEKLDAEQRQRTHKFNEQIGQLNAELLRAELDTVYNRIDMSFMQRRKWCVENSFATPLFALFTVDEPGIFLTGYGYHRERRAEVGSDVWPSILTNWTSETLNHLKQLAGHNLPHNHSRAFSLKARFMGAIPAGTRAQIKEMKPKFTRMYLVTESPTWRLESHNGCYNGHHHDDRNLQPVPHGKTLLIGETQGIYWLVNSFETTPSKDFVAKAFADDNK